MNEPLELHLRNDLAELTRLAEALETYGQALALSLREVMNLNLVLDELITNVISYGYAGVPPGDGPICLTIAPEVGRLVIELTDQGCAFNPLEAPAPDLDMDLEDRPIGGLGIHFARQFMDTLAYQRRDGENHLTMTLKINPNP